jgi:hypothetical protein
MRRNVLSADVPDADKGGRIAGINSKGSLSGIG